jgi:hypothetical protein
MATTATTEITTSPSPSYLAITTFRKFEGLRLEVPLSNNWSLTLKRLSEIRKVNFFKKLLSLFLFQKGGDLKEKILSPSKKTH